MSDKVPAIEVPRIALRPASAASYCQSVLSIPGIETWWFQQGLAPYRGFSRPFCDGDGEWWWRAKPQFAWPMNFFQPLERRPRLPKLKSLLGCQYPVQDQRANSLVHFNIIHRLDDYGLDRVASQKRRAIRKGLKHLDIAALDPCDPPTVEQARVVWNSHVERTGWNSTFDGRTFADQWRPLADTAGTCVIGARDRQTGVLCAWLIGRAVGGTVYVDTIASHTERLDHRPNDTLIFCLLHNAARCDGVQHANYFLRSDLAPLEKFKQSLGFDSSGLPARVEVNPLAALAIRLLKPAVWKRLR